MQNQPHKINTGFTLVEIMIVVVMVALLVALLMPNVQRDSRVAARAVCINNLHQIDNVKSLWATQNKITTNVAPTLANLQPYLGRGSAVAAPTCPADTAKSFQSSYSINDLRTPPACRILPGKNRSIGQNFFFEPVFYCLIRINSRTADRYRRAGMVRGEKMSYED